MPCGKTKLSSFSAAPRGPDALQVWEKSKLGRHGGHPSLKNDIGLEGCSPLQPGTYKGPLLSLYFSDKQSFERSVRCRGIGRPPNRDQSLTGRLGTHA